MTVKRFVTKRVEIDAIQYTGENVSELRNWTDGNFKDDSGPIVYEDGSVVDVIQIRALVYDKLHTTWIGVYPGQWIVRGAKGEFYPCDDETFHWKYEEVVKPKQVFAEGGFVAYDDASMTIEGMINRGCVITPNEARRMNGMEER